MSADSPDVSDEELLAEIAQEIARNVSEGNATQNVNESMSNEDGASMGASAGVPVGGVDYDGGAQLTTFQDNIITTGSDVSILLMLILVVLFVVQMIRKTYAHFTLQAQILAVDNPLDNAKPMAAENLNPINPGYDHTAYAVYNTEFEERNLYLRKQTEGAPPSVLKDILLKRAVKCVEKARVMQRDGVGIRKNWNMDLLPRDVWDDFQAAQSNIQGEIECVMRENAQYQFAWGQPHKLNIFSRAREVHEKRMMVQSKVFQQRQQLRRAQAQGQGRAVPPNQTPNRQPQGPQTNAPSAKSFGSGLQSGFFNNPSSPNAKNQNGKDKNGKNKRLTKREKMELKRQQKQMRNTSAQVQQESITAPDGPAQAQQTQPRRRKGRHRFANK